MKSVWQIHLESGMKHHLSNTIFSSAISGEYDVNLLDWFNEELKKKRSHFTMKKKPLHKS